MSRTARLVGWLVLLVGPPAAGIAAGPRSFAARHPVWAALAVLGWAGLTGIAALVVRAARDPVNRRLAQGGSALDEALGRRVTRYGRRYKKHLLGTLRFMDAKGLATVGDSVPELDEVFIDVALTAQAPHRVGAGVLAGAVPDGAERRSIWEFLDAPEPVALAVLGAPGSGKTTLLRHVARRIAREQRWGRRRSRGHGLGRRNLPILLELRDHTAGIAAGTAPTLPQLLRDTLPDLGVAEPPGWWEAQLRRGACVILLDGLDEVARAEDRRTVARWIEAQAAAFPGNDLVVTARPLGYRAADAQMPLVVQTRPFTIAQTEQFLHAWYRVAERRATGATGPEVDQRADTAATDLLDRLAATPALYDLAINPLLLTMIANVHRYRAELPGSRADLYDEMCQVMLWRRTEAKRLRTALPGRAAQRLLAHLAATMMREKVRDLPRARIATELGPALLRVPGAPDSDAFLAEIGTAGLLIEREHDRFSFAHLTFQEYLAAMHVREQNLEQLLVDAVADPWWRETILLYTNGSDADPIVRAALADGSPTALSLAFECADAAELAPELRDRLEATLDSAFTKGSDPDRRRVAAAVLTTRHLSQTVIIPYGGQICARPITSDLYRFFLAATGAPAPDGLLSPARHDPAPVTGVFAPQAIGFVRWLNALFADTGASGYRLPTGSELDALELATAGATRVSGQPPNVWSGGMANTPSLWTAKGRRASNLVTADQLTAAVAADARTLRLLPYLLERAVFARAHEIHALLSHPIGTMRPEIAGRYPALAFDLARGLPRMISLLQQLDSRPVAGGGAEIGSLLEDHSRDAERVRLLASAAELAEGVMTYSRGARQRREREHTLAVESSQRVRDALFRARELTREQGVCRELEDLDPVLTRTPTREPVFALEYSKLTVESALARIYRRALGGGFGDAVAGVELAGAFETAFLSDAFVDKLVDLAGARADPSMHIHVEALAATARRASGALSVVRGAESPYSGAEEAAAGRLLANAVRAIPPANQGPLPEAPTAAARLTALSLAGTDNLSPSTRADLVTTAAGITLLQYRAEHPDLLEALVLARV